MPQRCFIFFLSFLILFFKNTSLSSFSFFLAGKRFETAGGGVQNSIFYFEMSFQTTTFFFFLVTDVSLFCGGGGGVLI